MLNRALNIALALTFAVTAFTCVNTAKAQSIKDLVFYLPFDEGSGEPRDMSGNPTDVVIKGQLEWVDGKFGKGLGFDGNAANFLEADHSDKLEGMQAVTIMAWVNPESPDALPRGIVSKRLSSGVSETYNLFSYTGVKFCGRVNGRGTHQIFSDTLLQDDTWMHIAYVFDSAAKQEEQQKIYVDGALETTKAHPDPAVSTAGAQLYVGILNEGYGQSWNGVLDEVSIWQVALSEKEIQTLMQGPIQMAVQPYGNLSLTWGKVKTWVLSE